MWSLDGTAPGPGPILTPDLQASDGTLTPPPGTPYALALNGITLQARVVERRGADTLYRIGGQPLKLAAAVTGVDSDGWIEDADGNGAAEASYTRYDVSNDGPGFAVIKLSRVGWGGTDIPGTATVRIGPVGIGPDKQPAIEHVTASQTKILHHKVASGFLLPAPSGPWRVEITISPTFVPHDLDPSQGDRRRLGAALEQAGFQPLF
jgi:hypothetical protein